jgi:hypothetical protein
MGHIPTHTQTNFFFFFNLSPTLSLSSPEAFPLQSLTHSTAVGQVWIKWGKEGEFRQILKKKNLYLLSKVTLAVSKVRHLPPLRYGHAFQSTYESCPILFNFLQKVFLTSLSNLLLHLWCHNSTVLLLIYMNHVIKMKFSIQ